MEDPIRIFFELYDNVDVESVKAEISEGLMKLEYVESSEVQETNQRITGVELVATIGAVILVAKSAKEAIDVLGDVISSLTNFVQNLKGLKAVVLETHSGPKRLEEVTAKDFA